MVTAQVQLVARRGPVFQCAWQVPAGWQVERVEAEPLDPGLHWSVQPAVRGANFIGSCIGTDSENGARLVRGHARRLRLEPPVKRRERQCREEQLAHAKSGSVN